MGLSNMKCLKCSNLMNSVMTKKGVLIDVCSKCHGVWLDQGEINFFLKDWRILKQYLHFGLDKLSATSFQCPKCHKGQIQKGAFPGLFDMVEKCSLCQGLYLDAHEFKKLQNNKHFSQIQKDASINTNAVDNEKLIHASTKPPSLNLTTALVTGSLSAILLGLTVFITGSTSIPLWVGTLFLLAFVGLGFYLAPILLDRQIKLIAPLDRISINELPEHAKNSLLGLCHHHNLPLPRLGILKDSSPQIYAYGRSSSSARLVLSEGIFQILDHDETEAILAHELAHIQHWSLAVVTVIKAISVPSYNCYAKLQRFIDSYYKPKRIIARGNPGGTQILASMVYLIYFISEYFVIFISRAKRYHADRFSCFATKKPNQLITALIKMSYGLLQSFSSKNKSVQKKIEDDSSEDLPIDYRIGFESLNAMPFSSSKQMILAQKDFDKQLDLESIKQVIKWDLLNPWAFYYESKSTHPLIAKRINAIASHALALNQKPCLVFNRQKSESYWDYFFFDLGIVLLPYFLGLVGFFSYFAFNDMTWGQVFHPTSAAAITERIALVLPLLAYFVLGLSLGGLIRTLKTYPGGFFEFDNFFHSSVSSLLKIIKISPVRPYSVILRGQILRKKQDGQALSGETFFEDQTGLIFLKKNKHFEQFQGKNVVVTGWCRRSPHLVIEVKSIKTPYLLSKAYTYHFKVGLSCLGLIASLIVLFGFFK